MEKIIITINLPKSKNRNPYALDALTRRTGKIKLKSEKRECNKRNRDWENDG